SSHKQVRVTVDAGHAELDKAVGDRLFPALVHLLRNAVDHGIESPAARTRAGKPAEGHIHVSCSERAGNQLELRIADDGAGIDREAVAARHGRAAASDDELLQIIARPGLSTMENATHISGRGLGMDIVKRIAVDDLGGDLRLSSERGVGTTFALRVPLSITIVDAFSFSCSDEVFAVPMSSVDDLVEIASDSVTSTPAPAQRYRKSKGALRLLRHRDSSVPLYALSDLVGSSASSGTRKKAIIVRHENEPFAFEVDRMIGQQEIVVRPIRDPLAAVPGVVGSTDLGDGRPTLVLDLHGFVKNRGVA
ncbi:MAG TPA: chemotaxis protein CheW, partial [Myxococcota bacterium]